MLACFRGSTILTLAFNTAGGVSVVRGLVKREPLILLGLFLRIR